MDELKPCPWCRKPPKTCPDNSYGAAFVHCPDDNECDVSPMAEADLNAGETLDDAIRRWNSWNTSPAPSPADAGLVERLRADDQKHRKIHALGVGCIRCEAAARIEALSGEHERGVEDGLRRAAAVALKVGRWW